MKTGPRDLTPIEKEAIRHVHARAAQVHLDDVTPDTPARCEITGRPGAAHFSHRIAAGRGGTYRPANGLYVTPRVHRWLHGHPELAEAGGWHLRTGVNPWEARVWLHRGELWPGPGWYLINDLGQPDGGPHIVTWLDDQPPPPPAFPPLEGS